MKEKVKEIIAAIITHNAEVKNGRDYALSIEIEKAMQNELKRVLNEMYLSKEISVGNTINYKWIKLNNSN